MIEVVCGVIENGCGELLACLRPAGKHLGGLWEFPGGKIEPGESPREALVRELREELAIEVEVGEALTQVVWTYGETMIRLCPYRCRIIHGEPKAMEHEQLMWCAAENPRDLKWADADLPILAEILANR